MPRTKATPVKHATVVDVDAAKSEAGKKSRKKTHWKPGTVALREIKRYQKSVTRVIPRTKIVRLIRQIARDLPNPTSGQTRFRSEALDALHEAAEVEMVKMFQRGMLVALNSSGTTLQLKDMKTANAVSALA